MRSALLRLNGGRGLRTGELNLLHRIALGAPSQVLPIRSIGEIVPALRVHVGCLHEVAVHVVALQVKELGVVEDVVEPVVEVWIVQRSFRHTCR